MSKRPELVIGFVAPVGVNVRFLCDETAKALKAFRYDTEEIRLSKLLERTKTCLAQTGTVEDKRIAHLQSKGYEFRKALGTPKALAIATTVEIRERRIQRTGHPDVPGDAIVYLLNQLKHPAEVKFFREVYGASFVLIAAHATKESRRDRLKRHIADSESRGIQGGDTPRADALIATDEEEIRSSSDDFGQNSRNTYPLADIFINLEEEAKVTSEIGRFLDLLFGHPFITPRPDEVAMYHANAASLRSSDESRQVGAVIVNIRKDSDNKTSNVEIISTGMNEVPRRGGGSYWDGSNHSPDGRDQWLERYWNEDRALSIKKGVLSELLEVLKAHNWFAESIKSEETSKLVSELVTNSLKGTQFMSIGEFQRQVHAEMAAIIDSARRGVAVDGKTMFVTTFPCHNCAKHIIAAGISNVVYLEPYPKSRADDLHKEEILLDPRAIATSGDERVAFSPYAGIAPRQYRRLFNMSARGRKSFLSYKDWDAKKEILSPQHLLKNAEGSYLQNERDALASLKTEVFNWDPATICPDAK